MITGYTWEEVQAIPRISTSDLLQYLDETSAELTMQVRTFMSESARQPATALMGVKLTYY